jgi:uncharacterized protein involved in exopolysaccharide biosynthesis
MNDKTLTPFKGLDDRPNFPTAREVAAIFFRRKRVALFVLAAFIMPVAVWSLTATKYESQMKILVRRERLDPMITPQRDAPAQVDRDQVTEEDLNSEVELLKSSDLLRKVVLQNSLQNSEHSFLIPRNLPEEVKIAKAVARLSNRITARPIQKTNLILLSYTAKDPETAHRVLSDVAQLYVEKHLAVHRPSGQLQFFDQETDRYRSSLQDAEDQLSQFTRDKGVVSAQTERDLTLQKLSELERVNAQDNADIADAEHRIAVLHSEEHDTASRVPSQIKSSDNPQLMEIMKSTLLNLRLKRSDLAANYAPTYRPIQELDREIAQTQGAIESELKAPIREEATDRNQVYEWISSEIAKAQADLSGIRGKQAVDAKTLATYREAAQKLQQDSIRQADLLRDVKVQEDSYLLYQQKREEARISEALDARGIINVAIAEPPTFPPLPTHPAWLLFVVGVLGVLIFGISVAATVDFLDPTFKNPDQVALLLDVPVLAALPKQSHSKARVAGFVAEGIAR